nr:alpha/beta hydrolase [Micromonospora acroterricola]
MAGTLTHGEQLLTLVVHGDHDPVLPLPHGKALHDAIPRARLLVLEGTGHGPPEPVSEDCVSTLVRHTEGDRP